MKYEFILLALCGSIVLSQETATKSTPVYIDPKGEKIAGSLEEGTIIRKVRKTPDGKFIKATIDFYIPVSAVENSDVYAKMGTAHSIGTTFFTLNKVTKNGTQAKAYLTIKNEGKSNFKFTAAVLTKLIDNGGKIGDLNPFEGKNQGFAIVPPRKSITAELVYDFKKKPTGLVFSCKAKMTGEEIQYSVDD